MAEQPAEQKDKPQVSFFLVIHPDDAEAPPQVFRSDSQKAFSALVDEHVLSAKQPLYAFGFKGERIPISSPSAGCTIEIDGQRVPVGAQSPRFEESGRIVPLKSAEK